MNKKNKGVNMKKIKSMLQDAGIQFSTNGTKAVFNYIL